MKIIQIGSYPLSESMSRGGVEASVYGLSQELAKTEKVFVMDLPRMDVTDSCEEKNECKVYRFNNPGNHVVDSVNRIPDIIQTIQKVGCDICHIHGTGVFSWKIFQELKRLGITAVVTVHGLVGVEKKNALRRHFSFKTLYQYITQSFAERRLINNAPYLIVDTQYVAENLKRYNDSNHKITVIPQGIDDVFYKLSCSETSTEILSVGAFSARKGHLHLIKAFEELLKRGVESHLTICGTVAEQCYYQELQEYLKNSPFRKQVCLKCDISQKELYVMYQKAHLFALHSQEESQGIALVEAMAAGLPVVATKAGGIPNVVKDKEMGLLTEYGDISAFSNSLEELITNNEVWKTMSIRCCQESNQYAWSHIAERVEEVYQIVMGGGII